MYFPFASLLVTCTFLYARIYKCVSTIYKCVSTIYKWLFMTHKYICNLQTQLIYLCLFVIISFQDLQMCFHGLQMCYCNLQMSCQNSQIYLPALPDSARCGVILRQVSHTEDFTNVLEFHKCVSPSPSPPLPSLSQSHEAFPTANRKAPGLPCLLKVSSLGL